MKHVGGTWVRVDYLLLICSLLDHILYHQSVTRNIDYSVVHNRVKIGTVNHL
jgi:hypothetical protein